MEKLEVTGSFVEAGGETWYRIVGYDHQAPFFITLAGDSDLWAFLSTAGSLTAGRKDQNGAFFPYETVDKIHLRAEHTGPRTWVRILDGGQALLWQPFAPVRGSASPLRSVWKNLSGTTLRFREEDPSGRLAFEYDWSTSSEQGLIRLCRLEALQGPVQVEVLDGLLNLLPPGITFEHSSTMSSLTDAYKWNEALAGGRLGIFTLYAQIWDRAEPKESFQALTAWHTGLPADTITLLSDHQVDTFCRTGTVEAETLTRGRRGAFLVQFDVELEQTRGLTWGVVIDGPKDQGEVFELQKALLVHPPAVADLETAIVANRTGLDELLALADGFQSSQDVMAAAHHRVNTLFNIMRGGVFLRGTLLDREDLLTFIRSRNQHWGAVLTTLAATWPADVERAFVLEAARKAGAEAAERLILEYLPLTFSRRHGDPSRPWNRFSIKVRDGDGKRVVNYQGNWRDIFQNWEALVPSEPAFLGSMIATFVGSMTSDGYNPYRISRDGVDWEVVEPDNPWSNIGYWGDHQVVYLLKFLEAARDREPELLESFWDRSLFGFADVPYRLRPYDQQVANPKSTIVFDEQAHSRAVGRKARVGSDGLLVCDQQDQPVLATLGEKLTILLLAKATSLVPGGGLWLHTQRPEWNDANNALVGNGLSVVTLGYLRRFLVFLSSTPSFEASFTLSEPTLRAFQSFMEVIEKTSLESVTDEGLRRSFVDHCGALMDPWRSWVYEGGTGQNLVRAPEGLFRQFVQLFLPLVDATLKVCQRDDNLFQSYNLVDFRQQKSAKVSALYPMLEGQVSILSSGFLSLARSIELLKALFASPLYTEDRKTFLLYPDRSLAHFLDRNRLDKQALELPLVATLLKEGRRDILRQQSDGTVRFAPSLANSSDLLIAGKDLGQDLLPLVDAYDRLLHHHEFTGRSGTMFGYEGLGCVYWHMVAKLLLAVQELVFRASDTEASELAELQQYYRRVRDGLGYRKDASSYGAFPSDPYSHTPGEGGAQQPGMTGQVKEEILTRWGELGVRLQNGKVRFQPLLLDESEVPVNGALEFTYHRVPWTISRGQHNTLEVRRKGQWEPCPDLAFVSHGVERVRASIHFQRG